MRAADELVPDNPDGSGEAVTEEGVSYRYEHIPAASVWEVQTIVPLVPTAHLNTYHVPGHEFGEFLAHMDDDEHAERIISVRRIEGGEPTS